MKGFRFVMVCVAIGGLHVVTTTRSVAVEPASAASATTAFRLTTVADLDDVMWRLDNAGTRKEMEAIEEAAPSVAPAKPKRPRKVLVYGRNETHSGPVQRGFVAMEALGRKSGAFETVWTGDPAVFLPENLRQFDVVVMNNTHDDFPMLPRGFKDLDEAGQSEAKEREGVCKQSLLDFVAGGKGLAGIHAATIAGQWPEYLEMIGGQYGSCYPVDYKADKTRVRVEDPGHPLCAGLDPAGFPIKDEVYMFGPPFFSRSKVHVLLSFDLGQVPDAKVLGLKDNLLASTWVKKHGEGRVFYSSMGHMIGAFTSPQVMRCWLAGIQFAAGDLDVPVETPAAAIREKALEQLQGPAEQARIEALRALGRVGVAADVPRLVKLAETAGSESEKREAGATLARLCGAGVDEAIFRLLDTAEPATRRVLVGVVQNRATSSMSGRFATSAAIDLLAKAAPGPERAAVARAVMEGCRRYPEPRHQRAVLALLPAADVEMRTLLLPIVGEQGTREALAAIRAALGDADATVRDAAVRGLCNWPDASVAAEMLAVAKQPAKPDHRGWAVRGIARVMAAAPKGSPQAVALLGETLAVAEQPGDKQAVLSAVATKRSPEALALAVDAMANESIRPQAIQAVLQIAPALLKTHEPAARAALEKIRPLAADPAIQQRIDTLLGPPKEQPKPKAA